MSEPRHVYGLCQFKGEYGKVRSVFEEWELTDTIMPTGEGPHGAVQDEELLNCLNGMAQVVTIQKPSSGSKRPNPAGAGVLSTPDPGSSAHLMNSNPRSKRSMTTDPRLLRS